MGADGVDLGGVGAGGVSRALFGLSAEASLGGRTHLGHEVLYRAPGDGLHGVGLVDEGCFEEGDVVGWSGGGLYNAG